MGMKEKSFSLRAIFISYFATVILACTLLAMLILIALNLAYRSGAIIPANNAEQYLIEQKRSLETSKKFDKSDLPNGTTYLFISKSGRVVETDMSQPMEKAILKNFREENAGKTSYGYYKVFDRPDGRILVNYQLRESYSFAWGNKYLPSATNLVAILLAVGSLPIFIITTLVFVRRLQEQLKPVLKATEKIAEEDLTFSMGHSRIKEFNQLLLSLDKMRGALRDSLLQSWSLEREKSEQIRALAHDIRTPLTVVRGNTELLAQTALTEEQEKFVTYSSKNISQIENYINELSTIAKENSLRDFQPEQVSVKDFLAELNQASSALAQTGDLRLDCQDSIQENLEIGLDKNLFHRAWMNILSNAVEYSPKGGRLSLTYSTQGDDLVMTCQDSGPGFSAEALKKAHLRFFKDDKSRHDNSHLGIGLTIAENITQLHQGQLTLDNAESGGARVIVRVPIIEFS
ncbi:sensor histidine kinase [Streptococcus sobrinus]|uniref:sensor histidine kinase n=1 Tax=Streptococcus sobrinus TaxID=1310 RepID=UPI000D708939|nr:HAMP domain-containing sensor histidine kinase [Streptococcus sobrinus]AWN61902.1 sensor histidine kinase [Streptococcus sobrinus]AWN63773.1 sensor histidine kinase [Streptococcus sobrinus]